MSDHDIWVFSRYYTALWAVPLALAVYLAPELCSTTLATATLSPCLWQYCIIGCTGAVGQWPNSWTDHGQGHTAFFYVPVPLAIFYPSSIFPKCYVWPLLLPLDILIGVEKKSPAYDISIGIVHDRQLIEYVLAERRQGLRMARHRVAVIYIFNSSLLLSLCFIPV